MYSQERVFMDSYDVLVIILSISLAISIIVWIVVGVLVAKILKSVKAASEVARQAVDNVEEFTQQLRNAGKVTSFGTAVNQITKLFKGKDK